MFDVGELCFHDIIDLEILKHRSGTVHCMYMEIISSFFMKIGVEWPMSGELVALPDTKYLCSSQLWWCLCYQWDPAAAWILWSTAGGRAGRRLLGPRLFRTWENWPRRRRRVWPETSRSSPWFRMRPSLLSRHSLGKKWTWRKKFGKSSNKDSIELLRLWAEANQQSFFYIQYLAPTSGFFVLSIEVSGILGHLTPSPGGVFNISTLSIPEF